MKLIKTLYSLHFKMRRVHVEVQPPYAMGMLSIFSSKNRGSQLAGSVLERARAVTLKLCCITVISLTAAAAFALEADKNQPLHISADHVFLNHQTGMNTYKGRVKLIQGSSELTADIIFVTFDVNNKLKEIVAKGAPARYRTLFNLEKPAIIATANTMEYHPQTGTLLLIDDAKVIEAKNSFEGSRIEYNIQQKTVTSATAKKGQIHITLQPPEKSHE